MDLFLKYKWALIIIAVAAVIVALRIVMRRRKKRNDEREMSRVHRRNEALADALDNPMAKGEREQRPEGPMEISWSDKAENENTQSSDGQIFELTELSEYSRKKYVFKADKSVTIGSGNDNRMVIFRDGVAERHCVIATVNGKPCVRAARGEQAVLHRGKKTALISENGLFLNSGDKIELGGAVVQFKAFRG